jgi:hypothetical protein
MSHHELIEIADAIAFAAKNYTGAKEEQLTIIHLLNDALTEIQDNKNVNTQNGYNQFVNDQRFIGMVSQGR